MFFYSCTVGKSRGDGMYRPVCIKGDTFMGCRNQTGVVRRETCCQPDALSIGCGTDGSHSPRASPSEQYYARDENWQPSVKIVIRHHSKPFKGTPRQLTILQNISSYRFPTLLSQKFSTARFCLGSS